MNESVKGRKKSHERNMDTSGIEIIKWKRRGSSWV